jgi:beta-lactamase regulating signal transducer with metallopeptidase domain
MQSLLEIGLANAACAAILALVALIVGRLSRRPAIQHGLWLLVLLKLVTPPVFSLPLRVLPAEPVHIETPIAAAEPAPTVTTSHPPTSSEIGQLTVMPSQDPGEIILKVTLTPVEVAAQEAPPAPQEPKPANELPAAVVQSPSRLPTPFQAIGILWACGATAWFGLTIVRMVRFQRLLKHATPASLELQVRATLLARQMGLGRCPDIGLLPGRVPPLVWAAFGRPRVYLPAELVEGLELSECDTLLAHELAHLRRRDHWMRWLEFLVQGVYWWYPLVPLVRRMIQSCEEECCDALVVDRLPARSYAAAIVRTLDFLAGASPAPAEACGIRRVDSLKRRLTRIIRGGPAGQTSGSGRVFLVALGLASLPLVPTLARTAAPEKSVVVTAEESPAAMEDIQNGDVLGPVETASADGQDGPRVICYSPDGSRMALAMEDRTVEIRQVRAGAPAIVLRGHVGPVNCLAWSPDGGTLATGSSDHTVRLWNAATGESRATLKGHSNWVYALTFSPDGQTLASGGYDRTIRLWNSSSGKTIAILRGHESAVRALAFSSDGRTLASGGGDRTLRLWSMPSHRLVTTLDGHADTIRALAFAPDGRTIASASDDGTARLWDLPSGSLRATLTGHSAEVTSLAFAPWGPVVVTGGLDRTIRLWDLIEGQSLGSIPSGREGVASLTFDHFGGLTALGYDRQIRQVPLQRVWLRATADSEGFFVKKTVLYRRPAAEFEFEPPLRIVLIQCMRETGKTHGLP